VLGPVLALASALCWSAANVAIQGSSRRFGSWGALVWAQVIGGALVTVVALISEGPPHLPDQATASLIAAAATSAALAYAGLFQALRLGQVAVVTPIISAWSVVSVGWIAVAGGGVSRHVMAGVALVVIGNATVARTGSGGEARSPARAIGWAMASALGFGCMVPLIDRIGAATGRLWTIPWVWAGELAVGVPLLLALGQLSKRPKTIDDWVVAGRTGLFEVGGFISLTLALAYAPVAVVSPLSSLSTAGSVFLGLFLLKEKLQRATLVGAAIACAGVVVVNL
jgi:drug/metabolite transporter (DMT)-like permease